MRTGRTLLPLFAVILFGINTEYVPAQIALTAEKAVTFPLDPLSVGEIQTAVDVAMSAGKLSAGTVFPTIVLQEPPKEEVLRFRSGMPLHREALVVAYDREKNITAEMVIDLNAKSIHSRKDIKNGQPPIMNQENDLVAAIVHKDARWQEAMRKRNITDFENVYIDVWAPGTVEGLKKNVRYSRALSFYRGTAKNAYGHPIEGVVALVDLNRQVVEQVIDNGIIPVSKDNTDLDETAGKLREAPRPLLITQPKGQSFEIRGNEVRWQKWRFRIALHPVEGLVLYTVGYEDRDTARPILYRASMSEMVVPYGDTTSTWLFRSAFDEGEYGCGRFATSLDPGIDAPDNAILLDAVMANDYGKPYTLPRAIAVYERDGGILWRHYDFTTGSESRRSRELVVSYYTVIGNYDYGFNYIFHQDGSIDVRVELTGIMLAKGTANAIAGSPGMHNDPFGHAVSPMVLAPHHQHFFCFRLDFDVDGMNNTVAELNSSAIEDPKQNPGGNAFLMQETLCRREKEARRTVNYATARAWKVINPFALNSLGHPTGYLLLPDETTPVFARPESHVRSLADFLEENFRVTRYHEGELYAAGNYPNQSDGSEGLNMFSKNDEDILNTDIVLWYTLGITHIPRPEEWPVMPTTSIGFRLIPAGFFARNPAMDVPKQPAR